MITTTVFAQKNVITQMPKSGNDIFAFIPAGYDTLQTAQGDLNNDGKQDEVLVLYHKQGEENYENFTKNLMNDETYQDVILDPDGAPKRLLLIL